MKRPEQNIKNQFSKYFKQRDWAVFKTLAEYYLKQAAKIKNADIDSSDTNSLWIRNVQKRLFIGIACELLLKSAYLKNGYIINKPSDRRKFNKINYKLTEISELEMKKDETFSFNQLLDNYREVVSFSDNNIFERGFRIAKVFRNKEGHVAIHWHKYEKDNYEDIESALKEFYKDVFRRKFSYKISFEQDEPWEFNIEK